MHLEHPRSFTVVRAGAAYPAVASLQSGEDIFEALAAHTPVGIFISSAEGGCVYVNQRWCELTGLTPDQAMGDGWMAGLHPDDAPRVNREWAEAAAHGRDSVVEYRFVRPDGSFSWIEGYAAALRDDGGRQIGWVGTCLDFTARKEADDAVTSAAERFRAAFDNAPIGMALLTPEGRWIQVNPALCGLLGYTEEELLELRFLDVTHPDDRARSIARRRRQAAGVAPEPRIEKRYVRADGEVVWAAVTSTVVRDAAGEPLYTVAQIEDISERVQAQKALADAEERFHRAFDQAPVGMALATPDGRWLQVNPAFCELLGYEAAELTALTFEDVTHPDDIERSVEHSRRQLEGEVESLRIEQRFIRSDGNVVWVALTSSLTRDDGGSPLHFVAQIEDVTERVLAQRGLEEAEERFRRAFDDAPIGMALVGLDGQWLRVNPTLCEITGYSEEELLARTFYDITHPDDRDKNHQNIQNLIAGGTRMIRIEKRYVRPSGRTVWVNVSSSLILDADGKPLHLVSQIEDVTDRVVAQRGLEEAEERFRRAFDDAPIGMALVGLDRRWLRVNATLCEITGYSEDELLARTFQDISHPDDLERNLDTFNKLIAGDIRSLRIEKRYVRPNGRVVWVNVSSSLILDADGKPLHLVSQIEDVTARKRAESRLKDLAERDALTGLLNRRRFDEELTETILRVRRHGGDAALLLIDLDRFKLVNDTHGHKAGDELLVAVAGVLARRLRATDVVARLGGDEFGAVLYETDAEAAQAVAADLAAALRSEHIVVDGTEIGVTASIGIVLLDRETIGDDAALIAADRALYAAKSDGRDRIALAG